MNIEEDKNNLKAMLIDFGEYSTDYTKARCKELEETIENTLGYIHNLEQENKQLKEELETLKDNFDFNLGAIENIRKGKNKLEDKIDKAIEYIKENGLLNANNFMETGTELLFEKLLEILGDKENERIN